MRIPFPRPLARLVAFGLTILLVLPLLTQSARGQFGSSIVFDPKNFVVNTATKVSTATAITQRIIQIRHMLEMIRLKIESLLAQYQNLKHLGADVPPVVQEIRDLVFAYQDLLREGRALVYTAENFRLRFQEIYTPEVVTGLTWREQQFIRSETALDTYLGALQANHEFGRKSNHIQRRNKDLMEQALAAEGNLQALQAQALLQAHTAQQVSMTVEQLATLNNLLAVQHAYEVSTQESVERSFDAWLEPMREIARYETFPGLDPLPNLRRSTR